MSQSIKQFGDVTEILEAALASGGGTYELANEGKAIHWCQRAYTYRRKLQRLSPNGTSIYDEIQLQRTGRLVNIVKLKPEGKFTPAAKPDTTIQRHVPHQEKDELEMFAENLANKVLGINEDE